MKPEEREGWIWYLTTHYSRFLALDVQRAARDTTKLAKAIEDRTHPLLSARPGRPALTPEEALLRLLRLTVEELLAQATEARQQIEAARQLHVDDLHRFDRYETNHRDLLVKMAELGYAWDAETMRWQNEDRNVW